jgi:rhamnosyltransferase
MAAAHPAPARPVTVSIVLLTYNGMPVVEHCLSMIVRQELDAEIELVHIDSGSTDGTLDVARAFSLQTHAIPNAEFHHSRTRNWAATLAHNDIVVFLTQDAVPDTTTWLSRLTAPFVDPTVGGVYGRQIPPHGVGPVRRCAMAHVYPAEREVRDPAAVQRFSLSMVRFSNANSAIRRDLLSRLRFDERALVCEDHGMCRDILSAGYKVVYEPEATVLHGHERTLYSEFQWAVDNGISLTRMGLLGREGTARAELRYGFARVADQIHYFVRKHEYRHALMSICIDAIRWLGAQIGKREDIVPLSLLRIVSPGLRRVAMTGRR